VIALDTNVLARYLLADEQQENGPGSGPFSFAAGMTTAN
jgi:hypothetical protein